MQFCDPVLTIKDSHGNDVHLKNAGRCGGAGSSGPDVNYYIEQGRIISKESSLIQNCLLPEQPGIYTVTATWHAYSMDDNENITAETTVYSPPVTFSIIKN
jgi:hypothetical protein